MMRFAVYQGCHNVRFLIVFLLMFPMLARAEWGDVHIDFGVDKPWEELQAKLPPYPKTQDLQAFYVSGIAGNQYLIDTHAINIGKDGVVHYTLVVNTRGGASNTSFEGIRCATRERKIYAVGSDKAWVPTHDSSWQPIAVRSLLSYHRALADDYFCPLGIRVHSPQEALRNIRNGWHSQGDSSGL